MREGESGHGEGGRGSKWSTQHIVNFGIALVTLSLGPSFAIPCPPYCLPSHHLSQVGGLMSPSKLWKPICFQLFVYVMSFLFLSAVYVLGPSAHTCTQE